MATGYYYKDSDVNDVFAKCRSGLTDYTTNSSTYKGRYTYKDGNTTKDLADLGFVRWNSEYDDGVLDTICDKYYCYNFRPAILLPKGLAPHIEQDLTDQARTITLSRDYPNRGNNNTYVYKIYHNDNGITVDTFTYGDKYYTYGSLPAY
jgi:hypothetical protein